MPTGAKHCLNISREKQMPLHRNMKFLLALHILLHGFPSWYGRANSLSMKESLRPFKKYLANTIRELLKSLRRHCDALQRLFWSAFKHVFDDFSISFNRLWAPFRCFGKACRRPLKFLVKYNEILMKLFSTLWRLKPCIRPYKPQEACWSPQKRRNEFHKQKAYFDWWKCTTVVCKREKSAFFRWDF